MTEERRSISEQGRALILAAAVLDRPNADPGDDLAVLAHAFIAAVEALQTIALLDPSRRSVLRKYQQAVQTARMALGLEVK